MLDDEQHLVVAGHDTVTTRQRCLRGQQAREFQAIALQSAAGEQADNAEGYSHHLTSEHMMAVPPSDKQANGAA